MEGFYEFTPICVLPTEVWTKFGKKGFNCTQSNTLVLYYFVLHKKLDQNGTKIVLDEFRIFFIIPKCMHTYKTSHV